MELWIARDKVGFVGLYRKQPIWRKNRVNLVEDWHDGDFIGYLHDDDSVGLLDYNKFADLTFENSPKRVKIVIMEE